MAEATELAWAAGFFDGEGYTSISFPRDSRWPRLRVGITQHNRETLERFQRAVGVGTIYGPRPDTKRYDYVIRKIDEVRGAMLDLAPYLSTPKRAQASAAFAAWEVARVGPVETIMCEECGEEHERQLARGHQPNLRYCSKSCRYRAAHRRAREKAAS